MTESEEFINMLYEPDTMDIIYKKLSRISDKIFKYINSKYGLGTIVVIDKNLSTIYDNNKPMFVLIVDIEMVSTDIISEVINVMLLCGLFDYKHYMYFLPLHTVRYIFHINIIYDKN